MRHTQKHHALHPRVRSEKTRLPQHLPVIRIHRQILRRQREHRTPHRLPAFTRHRPRQQPAHAVPSHRHMPRRKRPPTRIRRRQRRIKLPPQCRRSRQQRQSRRPRKHPRLIVRRNLRIPEQSVHHPTPHLRCIEDPMHHQQNPLVRIPRCQPVNLRARLVSPRPENIRQLPPVHPPGQPEHPRPP